MKILQTMLLSTPAPLACLKLQPYHLISLFRENVFRVLLLTPWPESASELYRPSYRRLSAKLMETFAEREVLRSQRGGSPTAVISVF
jgi:hypothetical protein